MRYFGGPVLDGPLKGERRTYEAPFFRAVKWPPLPKFPTYMAPVAAVEETIEVFTYQWNEDEKGWRYVAS